MRAPVSSTCLAALCLGLGLLNWDLLYGERAQANSHVRVQDWSPEIASIGPMPPEPAIELTHLSETRDRPLFSRTRRPPVPEPSKPTSAEVVALVTGAVAPPSFELKGVLFARGLRKALIATPERPDGQWIDLGSAIAGWSLYMITYEGATVRQGDRSHYLALYSDDQLHQSRPAP